MARLSKRKKKKAEEIIEPKKPLSRKMEIWLISFIIVNIIVLAIGYQNMDTPSLTMYVLLVLALISIYIKRKFPVPRHIEAHLDMFGLATIIISFVLFLYVLYQKFTM